MFEATKDFFTDALNFKLADQRMIDILRTIAGLDDQMPLGAAIYDLHQLAPKERNYICCVLIERDQDPENWARLWDEMEAEAFD